jgi:hypothetical protein
MQVQLGALVDVAIALCGLFIAISTICSFLTEQVAVFCQLRGTKLFAGVVNLVFDVKLANSIFKHPLIDTTVNDKVGIRWPLVQNNYPLPKDPPATPNPADKAPVQPPADKAVNEKTQGRWSWVRNNRPSYIDPTKFAAAFWDEVANVSEIKELPRAEAALDDALKMGNSSRINAATTLLTMRKQAAKATAGTGTGVLEPGAHFEDLRQVVNAMPANSPLKANALVLLSTSTEDYASLLAQTATWFNHQMNRVSGWYTRQSQYIIIAFAAALVFISGLDTMEIGRTLYASPALLSAAASQVTTTYGGKPSADQAAAARDAAALLRGQNFGTFFHPFLDIGLPLNAKTDARAIAQAAYDTAALASDAAKDKLVADQDEVKTDQAAVADAAKKEKTISTQYSAATDAKAKMALLTALRSAVASTQSAVATAAVAAKTVQTDANAAESAAASAAAAHIHVDTGDSFSAHWVGWLITFVAASLGAPFWFNLLGKLINVRGAGPKPEVATNG